MNEQKRKPLNPAIKISANGRPYLDRDEAVRRVMARDKTNTPVSQPDGAAPEKLYVQLIGEHGTPAYYLFDPREVHDNGKPVYVYVRAPSPDDIAEKAERATRRIINGLPYEIAQHVNRGLLADIIAAEFGGGVK